MALYVITMTISEREMYGKEIPVQLLLQTININLLNNSLSLRPPNLI